MDAVRRRAALSMMAGVAIALAGCATPEAVAADGVQLIDWAPLAPVIVPVLFLSRAKDH